MQQRQLFSILDNSTNIRKSHFWQVYIACRERLETLTIVHKFGLFTEIVGGKEGLNLGHYWDSNTNLSVRCTWQCNSSIRFASA